MNDINGLLIGVIIFVVLLSVNIWTIFRAYSIRKRPRIFNSLITENICLNLIEDTKEFVDLEYFCEFGPASTLETSPWPGLDAVCLEADNVIIWYLASNWRTNVKSPISLAESRRITHQISVKFYCGNFPSAYLIYLLEDLSFVFRYEGREILIKSGDNNYQRAGDLFHQIHVKSSDLNFIPS